jgi:RNA polymerase sigma factor (sigma-70 family)
VDVSPASMRDLVGTPDDLLLAGLCAGDPLLTVAFVGRFQRIVFGVALGVVGDSGLAEDVAQQAFERAWSRGSTYDARRGSVRSWLIRITHNLAVDAARVRRPFPIETEALDLLIAAILNGPEHQAVAREASAELRQALAALPAEQARAVVLSAVHGLTAREVAAFEAIPLGTAKSRIRAALAKLHETVAHPTTRVADRADARRPAGQGSCGAATRSASAATGPDRCVGSKLTCASKERVEAPAHTSASAPPSPA